MVDTLKVAAKAGYTYNAKQFVNRLTEGGKFEVDEYENIRQDGSRWNIFSLDTDMEDWDAADAITDILGEPTNGTAWPMEWAVEDYVVTLG